MTHIARFLWLQRPFRPLGFWWWFTKDPAVQRWRWERSKYPLGWLR